MTAGEYFVRESISHARTLRLGDALQYLRGLLSVLPPDSSSAPVRRAMIALVDSDHQLELIASGQLKLPLADPKKGHRK